MTAFPLKSLYICEGGKSGKGLVENSKLPKSAQPVRVGKRERREREKKMSGRRLQMRLVSIRRSMAMEEKILCELMIGVHRQTRVDRLLKEIPPMWAPPGQIDAVAWRWLQTHRPSFLSLFPTLWSRLLERRRRWINYKDIMSEYITFQPNKSFFLNLYFESLTVIICGSQI